MIKAVFQHFFRQGVIKMNTRQRHFVLAVLFGKIQAIIMLALHIALVNGYGNIVCAFNHRRI